MTPISALGLFVARDFAIARSYRLAFAFELLSSVVNVAIFYYISRLIDPGAFEAISDLERGYFSFAVIGLSVLAIGDAATTAFASRVREDQTTGTLEALMATPRASSLLVLGGGMYQLVRALVNSIVILLVAVVGFGFDPVAGFAEVLGVVAVAVAIALFMAGVGLFLAGATLLVKQTSRLLYVTSLALALFSGAYYPLEVLPPLVEGIASAVPLTWGLDAIRQLLLGGSLTAWSAIALPFAAVGTFLGGLWAVERSVTRAKQRGTLTTY